MNVMENKDKKPADAIARFVGKAGAASQKAARSAGALGARAWSHVAQEYQLYASEVETHGFTFAAEGQYLLSFVNSGKNAVGPHGLVSKMGTLDELFSFLLSCVTGQETYGVSGTFSSPEWVRISRISASVGEDDAVHVELQPLTTFVGVYSTSEAGARTILTKLCGKPSREAALGEAGDGVRLATLFKLMEAVTQLDGEMEDVTLGFALAEPAELDSENSVITA